jgi:hypothetical protein
LYKLSDREILADLLFTQSSLAERYGAAALRSMHAVVRNEMLGLMNEEHHLHAAVADEIEKRGYRSACAAEQKQIEKIGEELKQLISSQHTI